GWPYKPKIPGAELAITSNEVFDLPEFPQRVAVYGGGYIALEFAGIFNGLGADTTLVYRRGEVLRGFDHDIRTLMREELGHKGVKRRLETEITALEKTAGGIRVSYNNGESEEVDQVLFATGRVPNVEGLGLESVGVETREGAVVVDEYSQTSVENIYAVGDVTDRMALTPVALMEGEAFARTVFGEEATPVDHAWVPSAVFSNPPIGTVGLTEEEARSQFGELDIYRSVFRPMKHTLSGREEKSMMKLVVDRKSQRVVGVHLVGLDAPEMLQGFGVAVKMGATKAQFDQTIGIHPTSAEELVTMRNPIDA
ncbi:MAG: FAD-dependent oxidoreductase, partial [Xanthomonadales bacterium]|nr:FAD-dependent oxidoreductase [Xanthomonadales bacterium]